jgi:SAM-dependent methyltransferase
VTVILGTEEDPRLPPGKVDLVVMVEVFHHLTRPGPFLATLARQVAPGASLVLVEPDVNQKDRQLDKGCYSDPAGTRKLAEQVGWRFETMRSHTVRDFRFYVLTLTSVRAKGVAFQAQLPGPHERRGQLGAHFANGASAGGALDILGDEGPLALPPHDEACLHSRSAYARLTVIRDTRSSGPSSLKDGSRVPGTSWPKRICSATWSTIWR